jgi:diguanylate cyclase (GGDEF)-like protein
MVAVGVLVYSLISDSERAKAEARANGLVSAAVAQYGSASAAARADAAMIARDPSLIVNGGSAARASAIVSQAGLARLRVVIAANVVADVGSKTAIAPGSATVTVRGRPGVATVTVSELTAAQYVHTIAGPGDGALIRQGDRTVVSTFAPALPAALPSHGTVTLGGVGYQTATVTVHGFSGSSFTVTILSRLSSTSASVGTTRLVAALFILAFLLLAFAFSVLASRALQGQVSRFLHAARRLAGGDFSAPMPTSGGDEFAALGQEFNNMSDQLARRLDELSQERVRLRESIRRIGQTLAANLDRPALLEVALRTAVDAVQAGCGRVSAFVDPEDGLREAAAVGSLADAADVMAETEAEALRSGDLGEHTSHERAVLSVPLGPLQPGARAHGVLSVVRDGRPFDEDERELLRSLSLQAALALENVELHFQIRRQALTDELTGLANHGRFQERLAAESEQVRRYHHPLGLIMLDIDDFKAINDTYGHPQGDFVLEAVARVVRDNSREADTPARYGGEEMALILPHTDLDGAYAIAERVRAAIEALEIPRIDSDGVLRTTASVGVAATRDGTRESLIAEADAALYDAKRQGKNRTVRAPQRAANVPMGE